MSLLWLLIGAWADTKTATIIKRSYTSMCDTPGSCSPGAPRPTFRLSRFPSPLEIVCYLQNLIGRHRSPVGSLGSLSLMSLPSLSSGYGSMGEEIAMQDFLAHTGFFCIRSSDGTWWPSLKIDRFCCPQRFFSHENYVWSLKYPAMKFYCHTPKPFVLTQMAEDSCWPGGHYGRAINVSSFQKYAWMAISLVYCEV